MKLRKNLKEGDTIAFGHGIRKKEAGFHVSAEIIRVLNAGDTVDGYGMVLKKSYLVEGSQYLIFETMNGNSEYYRGVIEAGAELGNIEYGIRK